MKPVNFMEWFSVKETEKFMDRDTAFVNAKNNGLWWWP
jgi:hypothetical protein